MNKENNSIIYLDDKHRITLVTGRVRRTISLYSVVYVEVEKRSTFYKITFKLGEDDYLRIHLYEKEEVDKLITAVKNIDFNIPSIGILLGVIYENSNKLF